MCLRTSLSAGLLLDISVIVMYICTCVILLSSQTTIWQSHVNSCLSCQFMSFMPIHGIHANSWHSGQFMAFMPIHVNYANSCQSCQFILFVSFVIGLFQKVRKLCGVVWCGQICLSFEESYSAVFKAVEGKLLCLKFHLETVRQSNPMTPRAKKEDRGGKPVE
jgi:hypothetical protein